MQLGNPCPHIPTPTKPKQEEAGFQANLSWETEDSLEYTMYSNGLGHALGSGHRYGGCSLTTVCLHVCVWGGGTAMNMLPLSTILALQMELRHLGRQQVSVS